MISILRRNKGIRWLHIFYCKIIFCDISLKLIYTIQYFIWKTFMFYPLDEPDIHSLEQNIYLNLCFGNVELFKNNSQKEIDRCVKPQSMTFYPHLVSIWFTFWPINGGPKQKVRWVITNAFTFNLFFLKNATHERGCVYFGRFIITMHVHN